MISEVSDQLGALSRMAADLGVPDPVREHALDVDVRWQDLHAAAEEWRATATRLEDACQRSDNRLGGIDGSWQGADADAFLAHMAEIARTSNDLIDAMRALADVLDHAGSAVHAMLRDFRDVISDGADSVSEVLLRDGEQPARDQLAELARPTRELSDAVADAMRALARFCAEFEAEGWLGAVRFEHDRAAGIPETAPAAAQTSSQSAGSDAPASGTSESAEQAAPVAAAPSASGGAAAGGTGMGMMPMGMMGAMGGSGQQRRQNGSRLRASTEELFGKPEQAAPAVLGEDRKDDKK